jgi:hypothetical protein
MFMLWGKLWGKNKIWSKYRAGIDILAGQNTPQHKPPKFLMGKQIKHLVSSSSF